MIRTLLLITILLTSFGCAAVGPDYREPEIAMNPQWNSSLKNGLQATSADPQELALWWSTLQDPILTNFVLRAVATNLDVKQAEARLRQARALRDSARAGLFPAITGSGSFNKGRSSEETGNGTETDTYSAGLDAAWELDLVDEVQRSVEAARGDLQAGEEDRNDVLVSLVAEVGLSYVEVRTYQARIAVAEKNLTSQAETFKLTQLRSDAGLSTDLAVQQARYNLESTRSLLPTLRTGLAASKNRLAVLLGAQPGAIHSELKETKAIPTTPAELAVGVPADVLRRRPDIRRSERELAAQTARVGVASAALYPKLTLSGSLSVDALSFGNLFSAGSRAFALGPALSLPLFNAGELRSKIEIQSALQEQAFIAYEASILTAVEEVENALTAYAEEQNRHLALAESTDAARKAAVLAEKQYNAGLVDFTSVLDAQRSQLSFEDELAASEGTVTSNLIRLYKALGGGWTPLLPDGATTNALHPTDSAEG